MKVFSQIKRTYKDLLVALLLTANIYCLYIPFAGVFVVITAILMMMYFLGRYTPIPVNVMPLIIVVFFWFTYSAFLQGFDNEFLFDDFLYFIVMGISGLYFSQLVINPRNVVLYMCIIALLVYPVFLGRSEMDLRSGEFMGLSYTAIRLIIPLICSLFFFKNFIFKLAVIGLLLIYLYTFLSFSSRGAVVAILFFLVLALFTKIKKHRTILVLGLLLSFFLIFANFLDVIIWLDDAFENNGIHVYSLHKIVRFAEASRDLDNGRGDFIKIGLSQFYESPIWGNGIGYFEIRQKIYVHNIFVQILLEGGILMALPFAYIFYHTVKIYLKGSLPDDYLLYISLLLSCTIIQLQFSASFWQLQHFWYYMGYIVLLIKKHGELQYYYTAKKLA